MAVVQVTAEEGRRLPEGYRIPKVDEDLLGECIVQVFRSSGPGGQSVNTTDSAVRLIHRPTGIRVQCQRERSQLRNKRECVVRLRARLEEMARPRVKRTPTKPGRAAKERRLAGKSHTSAKKRMRRSPGTDE